MTSCLDRTLLGYVGAADGIFDQVSLRVGLDAKRCPNAGDEPSSRRYREHNDECQK